MNTPNAMISITHLQPNPQQFLSSSSRITMIMVEMALIFQAAVHSSPSSQTDASTTDWHCSVSTPTSIFFFFSESQTIIWRQGL